MKCTVDKSAIEQHCGEAGDLEPRYLLGWEAQRSGPVFQKWDNRSTNGTRVLRAANEILFNIRNKIDMCFTTALGDEGGVNFRVRCSAW